MTFLACVPEQTADNLQRIAEVEEQIQQNGVTQAELDLAKNKIASHVVLHSERSVSRLFALGNNWIQRGCYRTVQEVVENYRAVTREDVGDVLARYPLTENTTVVIGPLDELSRPDA
jgi:predicted Zn-dependent peptidase